jgi:hypothetical protein
VQYSQLDAYPLKGLSYYRITQVDFNGKQEVFPVMTIQIQSFHDIEIYPNPVSDVLNINLNTSGMLFIYNSTGQLVQQQLLIGGNTLFDIRNFQKGLYFFVIQSPVDRISKQVLIQ